MLKFTGMSVVFLLSIILLVGCNLIEEQILPMPEEMPDDFDFSIRFGITSKNEINTFNDTVTKDLVTNGVITEKIPLTDDEMKSIYDRMREINILKNLKLEPGSTGCSKTPYYEDHWKIKLNGEIRSFSFSEEKCQLTEDAKKLEQLRQFVFEIVKKKEEYKQLPDAVGGYD